ncbi:DUF1145 domain-containing protein [Spongiibacter marinus]|uniref:DUF1145 domain-containing protein n=1 Tax=Spongiibacter marinus TaxID=354246 RepID=UPI0009FFE467|nr:DUF1145 domain-containing protein [Spongiibacter marinus]
MGLRIMNIATLVFWLAFVINFFQPLAGDSSHWINWVGYGLLAAHFCECLIFSKELHRDYANNLALGYITVLLLGLGRTSAWLNERKSTAV